MDNTIDLGAMGLGRGGLRSHQVHFYEHEDVLYQAVSTFVAEGIAAGDPIVIIATEAHRRAFCDRLRSQGTSLDAALQAGQLLLWDARETLSRFMDGAMPDWNRFLATVGATVDRVARWHDTGHVRAYGEMVDSLWRDGKPDAAIRLEEMWNDLQHGRSFDLLCAYSMGSFYKEPAALARVCATHSHVLPFRAAAEASSSPVPVPRRGARAAPGGRERPTRRVAPAAHPGGPERAAHEGDRRDRRRGDVGAGGTAVVDQVGAALEASSAALWLVSEDGREARLARAVGYAEEARARLEVLPLETAASTPALDALRLGEPIFIASQAELLARYPHLAGMVTVGRSYRIACLPDPRGREMLGSLAFTFDERSAIDDERARASCCSSRATAARRSSACGC